MTEPRTPRTEAGRSFRGACGYDHTDRILAIEAEAGTAPPIDVERLARALEASGVSYEQPPEQDAAKVAAEYARLSKPLNDGNCPECGAMQWPARKQPNHFSYCSQYTSQEPKP